MTPRAHPGSGITARAVAETVPDPELPILTVAELGILRDVRGSDDGAVIVEITPTYSGCPALAEIAADLRNRLHHNGFHDVEVHTVLTPAWTTDWITDGGRRKLAAAGMAPPEPLHGAAGPGPLTPRSRLAGPVPLTLRPRAETVCCPRCGSIDTEQTSAFGPTACTALYRCGSCREPFEQLKAI